MRKTLDLFKAGDHVDLTTAGGDTFDDVALWTLDQFGVTVGSDTGDDLVMLPWASVDRLHAYRGTAPRRDVAPSFFGEVAR